MHDAWYFGPFLKMKRKRKWMCMCIYVQIRLLSYTYDVTDGQEFSQQKVYKEEKKWNTIEMKELN